ncbi:hypothetical protein HDU96_009098 [Phlyctochytrium bullatum]|nr:hypothetical protein HDU96_009098 [Phlyctochytrium bullatum]
MLQGYRHQGSVHIDDLPELVSLGIARFLHPHQVRDLSHSLFPSWHPFYASSFRFAVANITDSLPHPALLGLLDWQGENALGPNYVAASLALVGLSVETLAIFCPPPSDDVYEITDDDEVPSTAASTSPSIAAFQTLRRRPGAAASSCPSETVVQLVQPAIHLLQSRGLLHPRCVSILAVVRMHDLLRETATAMVSTAADDAGLEMRFALNMACAGGHLCSVKVLVEVLEAAGATLPTPAWAAFEAVGLAASHGQLEVVKFLLSQKSFADIGARRKAMSYALAGGAYPVAKHLYVTYPHQFRELAFFTRMATEAVRATDLPYICQLLGDIRMLAVGISMRRRLLAQAVVAGAAVLKVFLDDGRFADAASRDQDDDLDNADPVTTAATLGSIDCLRMLLDCPHIDPFLDDGRALAACVPLDNLDLLRLFLAHPLYDPASPAALNAFTTAVDHGHVAVFDALRGTTPLPATVVGPLLRNALRGGHLLIARRLVADLHVSCGGGSGSGHDLAFVSDLAFFAAALAPLAPRMCDVELAVCLVNNAQQDASRAAVVLAVRPASAPRVLAHVVHIAGETGHAGVLAWAVEKAAAVGVAAGMLGAREAWVQVFRGAVVAGDVETVKRVLREVDEETAVELVEGFGIGTAAVRGHVEVVRVLLEVPGVRSGGGDNLALRRAALYSKSRGVAELLVGHEGRDLGTGRSEMFKDLEFGP